MSTFRESIDALRVHKWVLEAKLRTVISDRVGAFEKETGVAVRSVSVSLLDDTKTNSLVEKVSVSLEDL